MRSSSRAVPRPCVCTTVRTASRLLARVYGVALQDSPLNVTQLAVLRALERMEGEPLSRVAGVLSMDRTSLYRAAAKMAEHGWLTVHTGRDARSHSVKITDLGRGALEEAAPGWESVQGGVVEEFGRARWQALVEELEALGETVSAWNAQQKSKSKSKRGGSSS